jgi:NADPH:quinone reductase-like Zn-dependent oxidoreductase
VPNAIVIHATGGPDVMRWEAVAVGQPGPGQVRLKQTACGVNFLDTYLRAGTHFVQPTLPAVLGVEAAGIVVTYGLASGPLPPLAFADIPRASYVTRGTVRTVTGDRRRLLTAAAAYFDALARIVIWPRIDRTYPLRDAAAAHRDLEARKILGAAALVV